jgi:hypothetical protein
MVSRSELLLFSILSPSYTLGGLGTILKDEIEKLNPNGMDLLASKYNKSDKPIEILMGIFGQRSVNLLKLFWGDFLAYCFLKHRLD